MFFLTRSTTSFSSTVFVVSRLIFFVIRSKSSEGVLEGVKKKTCNYAEHSWLHVFLSQSLQTSYFIKLFLMYVKQKLEEYSPSGVNPLMLVVTKGHAYLNKSGSLN